MKKLSLALALVLSLCHPAHASYAFISAAAKGGTTATVTTAAINDTGADTVVCSTMDDDRLSPVVLTDSGSSTWTGLTKQNSSDYASNRLYYCQGAACSGIGASHTFSVTGNTNIAAVACAAFSGSTTSPFDVQNGNTFAFSGGPTLQVGSVAPSVDNELIVTGVGVGDSSGSPTIDLSFSIAAADFSGTAFANISIAYLIETTATAKNPTWTMAGGAFTRGAAATIATFKASGGGGGGGGSTPEALLHLGVGPGQ